MQYEDMASLLAAIASRQTGQRHPIVGTDDGTAPVELSVGYVSSRTRMVCHDGIVIKNAPPAIIDAVNKWLREINQEDPDAKNIRMEAGEGGIIIR
jgi:hypothetical protein